MDEIEKRTHILKFTIRQAINSSNLPLNSIENILDSIKTEIMAIELTQLRQDIIAKESEVVGDDVCENSMGG